MINSISQIVINNNEYELCDSYLRENFAKEIEYNNEIDKQNNTIYFNPEQNLILYNNRTYRTFSWIHFGDDPEQNGEWMQVCFYDKTKQGFVFYNNDADWDIENLVPIGIVVIPRSHDVYGDGSAGVISLVNMSWRDPDKGDIDRQELDDAKIYWGGLNHGLTVYDAYPILGNCNGPVQTNITGTLRTSVYLPNDKWPSGPVCLTDSTTKYYDSSDSGRGWCPSPYNGISRNPLYYQTTSPTSSKNPFSRFDGKSETTKLLENNTAQSNWKTASTINNNTNNNSFPAAACCWRFHTEYTNQGDWYLPAEGELGYLVPRFTKISNTIDKLNEVFGKVATGIIFDGIENYYSVNPNTSDGGINRIATLNGTCGSTNRTSGAAVRAFTKIKPINIEE